MHFLFPSPETLDIAGKRFSVCPKTVELGSKKIFKEDIRLFEGETLLNGLYNLPKSMAKSMVFSPFFHSLYVQ